MDSKELIAYILLIILAFLTVWSGFYSWKEKAMMDGIFLTITPMVIVSVIIIAVVLRSVRK